MKKRINPDRMIQIIQKYFKDSLSKPNLKNLSLATMAMAKSEKLTINEIARNMPVDVSKQKAKQTRLLRFLNNDLPLGDAIIILVDGVELIPFILFFTMPFTASRPDVLFFF